MLNKISRTFMLFVLTMGLMTVLCITVSAANTTNRYALPGNSDDVLVEFVTRDTADTVGKCARVNNPDNPTDDSALNKVSKFIDNTSTTTALTDNSFEAYFKKVNPTNPNAYIETFVSGVLTFEQRIRFSYPDSSSKSQMTDLFYTIQIGGRNSTNTANATLPNMNIHANGVKGISGYSTSLCYNPNTMAFTPDKWYTVKMIIDTNTMKYWMSYKDDNVNVWRPLTPEEGYYLPRAKVDGQNTSIYGINYIKFGCSASNAATSNGVLYTDWEKIDTGTAVESAWKITQSDSVDFMDTVKGINEDFENYELGDFYQYFNDKTYVASDGITKTDEFSGAAGQATIEQKITEDPFNPTNKVNAIKLPATTSLSANIASRQIMYCWAGEDSLQQINGINDKAILRFKFMADENVPNAIDFLQFSSGNVLKESAYPTNLNSWTVGSTFGKMAVGSTSSSTGISLSTDGQNTSGMISNPAIGPFIKGRWYDVIWTIDTKTQRCEVYRKDLSDSAATWVKIVSSTGTYPEGGYPIRSSQLATNPVNFGNLNYLGFNVQQVKLAESDSYIYMDDLEFLSGPTSYIAELPVMKEIQANEEMPNGGVRAVYSFVNGAPVVDNTITMANHDAIVFVAVYDSTGTNLLKVNTTRKTLLNTMYIDNVVCDVPYPSGDVSNYKVKAFVWEDGTLKPLNLPATNIE